MSAFVLFRGVALPPFTSLGTFSFFDGFLPPLAPIGLNSDPIISGAIYSFVPTSKGRARWYVPRARRDCTTHRA